MSEVIQNLEVKVLRIRRDGGIMAAFGAFVLSEIRKIGKNSGNRNTTNDEAITVLKKLIATNESNIAITKDDYMIMKLKAEIDLLKSVLPEMASETDVLQFLRDELGLSTDLQLGQILKLVKNQFGSLVDMKYITQLIKQTYLGETT